VEKRDLTMMIAIRAGINTKMKSTRKITDTSVVRRWTLRRRNRRVAVAIRNTKMR